MLIRKIAQNQFPGLTLKTIQDGTFLNEKFYLCFPTPVEFANSTYLDNLTEDKVLLEVPNLFTLRLINRSLTDNIAEQASMKNEGCFYFKEEKEWILEAVCHMVTADGTYQNTYLVRLPLSAPFAQKGMLGFCFDGTWLRFMKEGRILNENSALDCFCMPIEESESERHANRCITIAPGWEQSFKVGTIKNVTTTYLDVQQEGNVDFYSPAEWNTFAGDVMNFYHEGIYHLIYLRDRRHHGSRNGEGGHDIYQLTSKDLIHWQEQEPVASIDAPWKSYGTGTMLFHNGKYYMTYGFHTERYHAANEQVACKLDEEKQEFSLIDSKLLLKEGRLPAGASYSVSEDGIHFVPTGIMYHPGRNPSTYVMSDGKLRVYAGYMGDGIWESESFDKPFRQTGEDFSFVNHSVMRNSTECPSFFTWNDYKYLVIGFTGYYRSLTPNGEEYVDMAGREEIYDGLNVPMITSFGNDRRLMAGWLNGIGWGSVIVHRELIQEENGKLGMKWVPEMIPEVEDENLFRGGSSPMNLVPGQSYLLSMTVNPQKASRMGLQFLLGEEAVEFQLDFDKKRIQMMDTVKDSLAPSIPTSYEVAVDAGEEFRWHRNDLDIARNTKNFCIADIQGMDDSFCLQTLIRVSRKMRSTVIDVEVAGRRTMISVRDGFFPESVQVVSDGDVAVSDICLQKLKMRVE